MEPGSGICKLGERRNSQTGDLFSNQIPPSLNNNFDSRGSNYWGAPEFIPGWYANYGYVYFMESLRMAPHYDATSTNAANNAHTDVLWPTDSAWHAYEYHVKLNSSPGIADGIVEFWIDGIRQNSASSTTVPFVTSIPWAPQHHYSNLLTGTITPTSQMKGYRVVAISGNGTFHIATGLNATLLMMYDSAIDFSAATASGLSGKYITVQSSVSPHSSYYVWFNTGASVDPAPSGFAGGLEVDLLNTDTAVQIAAKAATVISAKPDFSGTTPLGTVLRVSNNGYSTGAGSAGSATVVVNYRTTVPITPGDYTGDTLAAELLSDLNSAFSVTGFAVTWNSSTRLFMFSAPAGHSITNIGQQDTYPGGNASMTIGFSVSSTSSSVGSVLTTPYMAGGQSGTTQPNWLVNCPNVGDTCVDNELTWQNYSNFGFTQFTIHDNFITNNTNTELSVYDDDVVVSAHYSGPPPAPANVAVTSPSAGTAQVSWTAGNNGATYLLSGYRVYYGTTAGALNQSVTLGTGLSTPIAGLVSGQTYYFQVTAVSLASYDSNENESLKSTVSSVVVK